MGGYAVYTRINLHNLYALLGVVSYSDNVLHGWGSTGTSVWFLSSAIRRLATSHHKHLLRHSNDPIAKLLHDSIATRRLKHQFFYVLLTVHLSIILAINQLNEQNILL